MTVFLRSSTYHLRKRVPQRFRSVEPRDFFVRSLHTDSKSEAERKAREVWELMLDGWELALRSDTDGAKARHNWAENVAAQRGFSYKMAAAVAAEPLEDVVRRILASTTRGGAPDHRNALALLGAVEDPGMTVSEALNEFWKITVDQVRGKTLDQVRRWENPKKKAIGNFIAVVGDKRLDQITRADAKKFRDWWNERIDREGLTPNSANKDFTHIGHVLKTVNDSLDLKAELPFGKLTIKAKEKSERLPFSDKWIKDHLLKDGALAGLNAQARSVLLMMVNTGCRPSELAGLLKRHIHLDGQVPHIEIKPEGRELKNATSARKIPLLGVSFAAAKDWLETAPDGDRAFPEYFGRDKISAVINKFLRENKLLESDAHTLYGLRHSFEDRCLRAGIDERVRRDLMGHSLGRQRYGEGGGLAHVRDLLKPVAF